MAKDRFMTNPFKKLSLSSVDMDELQVVAETIVKANEERHEQFMEIDNGKVDRSQWKCVKRKGDVRVYLERQQKRYGSSSPEEDATANLESLLCVGSIPGRLDDVMNGIVASYTNGPNCSAVLSTVHEPTEKDPLRSVMVKWMELDTRLMSMGRVKNRDYVYVETTGVKDLPNGERLGYHRINVRDAKGAIMDAEIMKAKPQVMVEIGTFCGYSAVRLAKLDELSDIVTFVVGFFSETYTKLKELGINHVDVWSSGGREQCAIAGRKLLQYLKYSGVASLLSGGAIATSPGRPWTRIRVGLDAAVLDNQKKWKRLTDIDDDNSTAKSMASEVQLEFMKHRQQLAHEQKRRLGSGIPTYHFDSEGSADVEEESEQDPILSAQDYGVAMEEDRYLIAAAFIKDGVHGRKIGYRLDRDALLLNELFHSESYRMVYMLVVAIMSMLAFVEIPGDQTIDSYLLVDLLCLFLFGVDLTIRWYMSSVETQHKYISRQPWAVVRMMLLLVSCADLLMNLLFPTINPYRYSRALRPFFFITRGRNIRIIFSSLLHALRQIMIVLLLNFCFVAFFGLVGYLIFSDTSDDPTATFFNSLSSSMYTMLLIHNCMPYMAKSMYPYYKMTHWSAVFFVLFVLLTNLFLLKLTIAVSYKSYKKNTENMLYKRLQKRKAALYAAFDILAQNVNFDDITTNLPAPGGVGGVHTTPVAGAEDITLVSNAPMLNAANRRGSSRFFTGLIDKRASFNLSNQNSNVNLVTPVNKRQISLDSWITVCEYLKPSWTPTDAELVFNSVDIEHVGFLDLTDFYQLCSLLSVKLERSTLFSNSLMRRFCTARQRQAIRRFRTQVRSTLLYEVYLFGHYRVVLAELVVGILICLSVVQSVQVNNIDLAFSVNHSWRMLGFFLLILFTLEVLVKMFAFGYSEFFTRPFCKLDLAVVSVGWIFFVLTTLETRPHISLVFYDMALAVRSLRFLKLLNLFPPFHEILYTMKAIMPLIMQLLLVIFSVMYAFAIVTQANFGVELRNFPPSKQSLSPGWYAQREEFQAETFEQTLVTLFGVANLAGWNAIMDAAHAMTGSPSTYVFFFAYRMTMSNILLPIFVGFLVESFVSNAKTVESTIQTSYVNSGHEVTVDDEENRMALLETRHMHDDDLVSASMPQPLSSAKLHQQRLSESIPLSPSSVSDSSASEVRFKYRRRGSVVHDQMFDAVKLSDVSRLTLQVEQKHEEMAQQDAEMRKLEGNVLSMKSRLSQSQHVILAYEAKLEELSATLRESQGL
ncbi:hypothetical protein JM18_001734 [Phytophthora kernoviae]|uniref:Ion transport domain-containing protein n=1 Tax=Phytophthora kernoviae TaxID=325452 RepID=A0A921VBU8_9STRA|nr:hypothetical protein JM18_001734 [Phytophthora kernoviae]